MKQILFVFGCLMLCLCSCTKQADIQKVYNSGPYMTIASYDFQQIPSALNNYKPESSDIGYAMIYDKAKESFYIRYNIRSSKSYNDIRYNNSVSDDSQICLQNDEVRFVIMNSGEAYIVKMYLWYNRRWNHEYSFANCEIESVDSYELPKVKFRKNKEQELEHEETSKRGDSTEIDTDMAADTYEVVEADSYDGFVSIRVEKSSKSRELGRLPNGEFADFLAYDGEWYKINYEGITGYVYGKYAKKKTMINP